MREDCSIFLHNLKRSAVITVVTRTGMVWTLEHREKRPLPRGPRAEIFPEPELYLLCLFSFRFVFLARELLG